MIKSRNEIHNPQKIMHKRAFSVPAVDEIMKSLTDALNATLHVPRVYNITQVTFVNKQYRK